MRFTLFLLTSLLLSCTSPAEGPVEATAAPAPPPTPVSAAAAENDSIPAIPSYTYLTGKFDPTEHPDFVKVAGKYTDGDPYVLQKDTYAAFEKMHAAALNDGVKLIIVSATRNFARQKQIWEAKWNGQRLLEGKERADEAYPDPADRARAILRYSSMPGTSRHHWGTDMDLNALNNGYFDDGEGQRIYAWLTAHGADYGFCQPYTVKGTDRPSGYEEERWHWSYLPLATQLTDYAATELRDEDISGFAGAESAPRIEVVRNYVLGVNPACKK
ncbi:LAS superfamily LD-carboxypeptidase LdcB [Lewinella aquimaris]|uniref:LAS superfamily LD-carboxypeptidase LdcB n=1 Tax=Neolewinella aquimaris TaxID=1835722 RepID=A0A840E0G9_9BACT|nr:M15 family metallopeptidase [Neolewinella aquimaris]MBB4078721.1 LAS superfamily LD-carboxypeptidase LdcB [Neolewinella aquimaris]